jgi:hypothetical protein
MSWRGSLNQHYRRIYEHYPGLVKLVYLDDVRDRIIYAPRGGSAPDNPPAPKRAPQGVPVAPPVAPPGPVVQGGGAAAGGGDDFPQEFEDPISQEMMTDPVMTPSGHTYERASITEWIDSHGTDLFGTPLTVAQLVPNIALRNVIERYLEQKPKARSGKFSC